MTDDPLIAAFFEGAVELLADFEAGLLKLEEAQANYEKVRGVAGATILGDGRVTLILDVPGLIALARAAEAAAAA